MNALITQRRRGGGVVQAALAVEEKGPGGFFAAQRLEKPVEAPLIRLTILLNRGRAFAALNQINQATSQFAALIKEAASARLSVIQRDGLMARGDLHAQSGRLNDAIDDYRKAVEISQSIQAQNRGARETEREFLRASQALYEKVTRALLRRNGPAAQLPDGHLVVTFLPTDDALYLFLVTKNSGVEFRQNQKISRRQLHEKIAAYRELITNVQGKRSEYRIDSWDDPK